MARSRNIKPGFFTNDELAELPALTRLLFIGLWTLVDRDGRIEDRPKKIKAGCMPYDDIDADAALSELCKAGFILRYEADNTRCIQVQNWHKHQNPHVKELASTLPAPDKHQTSTVHAPDKTQPQPEPARLIPDSLPLIPDSSEIPSNLAVAPAFPLENRQADPPQLALVESPKPKARTVPDCPHQAILALWAECLPALPQHNPGMWNGTRADHLRARWRETAASEGWESESQGLEYFRRMFVFIGRSAFLTGRAKTSEGRPPFIAELAWIVSPQNWAKVHEGKYHTEAA